MINTFNGLEIKDFDVMIERSFLEVLTQTFFFASNAELQNEIIYVLYKFSSQKETLMKNIKNLVLLFSHEHHKIHFTLQTLISELTNLTFSSQVWLQILDKQLYKQQFLDHMKQAYKKLSFLEDLFLKNSGDSNRDKELLKIK